jgi:hypothetical protein
MPCVGFETTIPASERAKVVHALDRSATVTGQFYLYLHVKNYWISIYLWLYSSLLGPARFFSLFFIYTVGTTPWTGDQPAARPLATHRTRQTQNKRTKTSLPQVGLEPTIPVFVRAKRVLALDRAATVTGRLLNILRLKAIFSNMYTDACQTNNILVRMSLILLLFYRLTLISNYLYNFSKITYFQ